MENRNLEKALELNMRFNGEASMVTVRTKESIADNLARQGKLQEAKSAYLALEMDLERDFGFKPSTSLREGLRKFARWYKEYYLK